jgi:hypothetical protein
MYRSRRLVGVSALSIFFFLSTVSTTFLGEIRAIASTLTSPSAAHSIAGTEGDPAAQDIPSISQQSYFGPDSIDIIPASPTHVSNCIPFGNNTGYGFSGFIYRDVPPFTLQPGLKFAFDRSGG